MAQKLEQYNIKKLPDQRISSKGIGLRDLPFLSGPHLDIPALIAVGAVIVPTIIATATLINKILTRGWQVERPRILDMPPRAGTKPNNNK